MHVLLFMLKLEFLLLYFWADEIYSQFMYLLNFDKDFEEIVREKNEKPPIIIICFSKKCPEIILVL